MNDRELIDNAAKAAKNAGMCLLYGKSTSEPEAYWMYDFEKWNPLTDDGDALRLAVSLELDILRFPAFGDVQVCSQNGVADEAEKTSSCPYAATRRAIVRAAAAIGAAL